MRHGLTAAVLGTRSRGSGQGYGAEENAHEWGACAGHPHGSLSTVTMHKGRWSTTEVPRTGPGPWAPRAADGDSRLMLSQMAWASHLQGSLPHLSRQEGKPRSPWPSTAPS